MSTMSPEVRILRDFREHMHNLIWIQPDMSVQQANQWLNLLYTAPSLRKVRQYGFKGVRSTRDKWRTIRVLQRFVRIWGAK